MRVYQLFIELIVLGGIALLATNLILAPQPQVSSLFFNTGSNSNQIILLLSFVLFAWVVGFLINILSVRVLNPVYQSIVRDWMQKEGNPSLVLEKLRYKIYVSASSREITRRIEYHHSLIRISRCILFQGGLFFILAIFYAQYIFALMALFITILSATAYYHSVIRSIKAIYYAWTALNHHSQLRQIHNEHNTPRVNTSKSRHSGETPNNADTHQGDLKVLAFSGGTGFREINMALALRTQNVTRVVPIWDNGGSSKALRESFQLMPVGDIRHALMTQAHGEGRVGSVVKLFNWRLSGSGEKSLLKKELDSFVQYQHPLIGNVEQSLGHVIITYLRQFADCMPEDMDLRNGSIGNFVLVGAYLAHNKDLNTAIYVFRQLCSIQGNVWPVSLHNHLHINAILENHRIIAGQENTTRLDREHIKEKIERIIFNRTEEVDVGGNLQHTTAQANPIVVDALKKAQVIVYGPGSFFTSILPHIMVEGIADEISNLDIPKVFIGNLLEDNESHGYTLDQLVDIFVNTANQYSKKERSADKYISHILVNQSHAISEHTLNDRRYLKAGDIQRLTQQGMSIIIDDLESPWKRGQHDANWIADFLVRVQNSS